MDITVMARKRQRLVRTTISLPASMKEAMSKIDTNWSEEIREMVRQRLEEEQPNSTEAVIVNERLRRKAPEGWSSVEEIKKWRRTRS